MAAVTIRSIPMPLGAAFELRGTGTAAAWVPPQTEGDFSIPDAGQSAGAQPPSEPAPAAPGLPRTAKIYVGAVTLFGAALLGVLFPQAPPDPVLSMGLFTLVVLGSTLKVHLPVPGTTATLSVSFIANFIALILVGPGQAMVFAAIGAAVQCMAARRARPLALYRVLFSMSALVITVQVTHLVYSALGGQTGIITPQNLATPVVGGAFAYFLCNAILVALATSLATGQSAWQTWTDAYLWSGASFVAGAGVAVAAAWFIENHEALSALALAAPVYLTYRTYHVYLGHIEREQQHAAEVSALNTKAMRALDQARRSEQALALEKERLGVTLSSIGDAVLAADTRGRIVLLNHAAEEYTGWAQDDAVGTPVADVFRIVDRESGQALANPVPQVLRTKARVDRDNRAALVARDGTQRLVEYSATPVCDQDGAVVAVVIVARDVTEAVQVDAERHRASKLAALGVLAGGIAHDFNNILTAIVGNISLAQLDDATDAQRASLVDAEKACMRAKGLTHQLLTFSKGGAPLKKHILLPALIRSAATFALRGSNVKCAFDLADDLWLVNADEQQFVQVLNNLVINAMQAMPDGGVVRIRAENVTGRDDAQAPHVRLTVRDHGVGIPAEHLGKIFDPYFTTKAVGQGLGLATSYSVVANHGGSIAVESCPGRGTTMTILLPAVNDLCTLAPVDLRTVPAVGRRGRILVMDDEEQVRDVTRMMLRRIGYRVEVAADGEEAVAQYRESLDRDDRFDAVLMDLTIPGGMGGKAAIRELLAIDPGVTAIVSSGYADAPVMADFEDYGFKGVVPKPFTFTELRRLLQQVVPAA